LSFCTEIITDERETLSEAMRTMSEAIQTMAFLIETFLKRYVKINNSDLN